MYPKNNSKLTLCIVVGLFAAFFFPGFPFGSNTLEIHSVDASHTQDIHILYVGGTGDNNYTTIKDAVADANDGDTIFVYNGTYKEYLLLTASITLLGEDKNTTVIQGLGSNIIIRVVNARVNISGFTITDGFAVINGTVVDGGDGILLYNSRNSRITGNIINHTHSAIKLWYSHDNLIMDNLLSDSYEGIILWESGNNTITNNTITSNIDEGIYLWKYCHYNTFSGNIITKNGNYGIYLDRSSSNLFQLNVISDSQFGIYFYYSTTQNNTLIKNTLQNNYYALYFLLNSENNTFFLNNFITNDNDYMIEADRNITNRWYSPTPQTYVHNGQYGGIWEGYMGNYWDTHSGTDTNLDGIADNPYPIDGDVNNDFYPLLKKWETYFQQENIPPQCILTADPAIGESPLTTTFSFTATDPDGTITSWELDVNSDTSSEYHGTGPPPVTQNHTYTTAGTYNATFTVTDNNGTRKSVSLLITVTAPLNEIPSCNLTSAIASGYTPLLVTFMITAYDTDGFIASWTLDIDNDGQEEYSGTGTPPSSQTHTYQESGIFTATLTVNDNDEAISSSSKTITVLESLNEPPVANFTYSPDNPTDLDTITFQDQSNDSDGTIISHEWDFGDTHTSNETNPSHTYSDDGIYNVTLTVTDNAGGTNTAVKTINVSNVKPEAQILLVTPLPISVDTRVELNDTSSDPDGTIVNHTWTLGDGTTAYGTPINHTYTREGTYNVTLTITDDDGDSDTTTLTLVVAKKETDGGIPGFEMVPLCSILVLVVLLKKKRR